MNIAAVVVPFVAVALAVPLLWGDWIGPSDVSVFAVMWRTHGQARAHEYARELIEDRGMRRINR